MPTMTESDETTHILYPQECRLRNLTYVCLVACVGGRGGRLVRPKVDTDGSALHRAAQVFGGAVL